MLKEPKDGEHLTRAWRRQGKLIRGGVVRGSSELKDKKAVGS